MPVYVFRCPGCGDHEHSFAMGDAPAVTPCVACGGEARRRWGGMHVGRGSSPAMRALDAAARSASEPRVVSGSVPGASRRPTPVSHDPRHARLPRP